MQDRFRTHMATIDSQQAHLLLVERGRRLAVNIRREINIRVAERQGEYYAVYYTDRERGEALRTLGRWASDPDLSFTWRDAAAVVERMKEESTGR